MPEGVPIDRRALRAWFDTPLGRSLQVHELHRLRSALPTLYGTLAVQLGRLGPLDLLEACVVPTRILVGETVDEAGASLLARPDEIPLATGSVDLLLLPHTLDYCEDPHGVLREVNRVLSPEGHVIVLGFNPWSWWGLRRLFTRRPRPVPWCGQFLPLTRIKDWLRLLDFDLAQGGMMFYRPPMRRESFMERLRFLDKAGDRWWPMSAAVYLLVARKRVAGMTPLRPAWKLVSAKGRAAPEAATRAALWRTRPRRGRAVG
ncbi:MAG: methyltransferase domain-containing protein [Pseudomonadota bacterium]